ncbi:MAG: serine/threonine-protein kinase, partial [Myxococcota bacterium]
VFEVGEHEGHTFVAMELVEGGTLADWLTKRPRGWREILEMFRQAGEGLIAAHDVGLVHRDFKPHNVLVGADGRVRVVDFGLATDDAGREGSAVDLASSGPVTGSLTRTGELLGTPAFMSPEQFSGEEVGPASDQFAFCIALYQALAGRRPFSGDSVAELANSVLAGKPEALPTGSYPEAIDAVVAKGLARHVRARHGSMRLLLNRLAAVSNDAQPRSPLPWLLGGLVATLAIALAWVATRPPPTAPSPSTSTPPPSPASAEAIAFDAPDPGPRPPDGPPPRFEGLDGPRGLGAIERYGEGCREFAEGRVRAASEAFGLAAEDLVHARGTSVDLMRINYARALAHEAAYLRDGHVNDLRVAYELLRRIDRDGGTPPSEERTLGGAAGGLRQPDGDVSRALAAFERITAHDALPEAGIDPRIPSRFALTLFNDVEPGTEIAIDNEVIGHAPCTGAVVLDKPGHMIVARHRDYYDVMVMWNPREENTNRLRAQQSPVPAGKSRDDQQFRPLLHMIDLPAVITTPEDWPR